MSRAPLNKTLVDEAMPRDKPVKLIFAPFRCPRCKRGTSYSLVHSRFWRPIYWCEACDSYFVMRNNRLLGTISGVAYFALCMLALSGPLFRLLQDRDISGYWLGLLAVLIAVAIWLVLWATIFSRFQRFEYVGKNDRSGT